MDSDGRQTWARLLTRFAAEETDVAAGCMMSAEALTFASKVFAFYSTKGGRIGLGCRLGRDYPIASLGLGDWQYLAPFKTKPPMRDWIVAGVGDLEKWPELCALALDLARNGKRPQP
ncbi:MAG: hypothetical protein KDE08_02680 [Rhodobacteraceae bacterium]|nr:hypothetical protein [Paracoccaceae bacterium]